MRGVSWGLYRQMLHEIGDGRPRLTYDQGSLEIMSPSGFHESVKIVLARLILFYSDAAGITLEGRGSTTFLREDLQKGLEPDDCYYVANAEKVMGRQEFDPASDPPPDLAIEVDLSRPKVSRQPIYASLGVPEIWRFDGRVLEVLVRVDDANERYVVSDRSLAFPKLPMREMDAWLQMGLRESQSAAVKSLRAWVNSQA